MSKHNPPVSHTITPDFDNQGYDKLIIKGEITQDLLNDISGKKISQISFKVGSFDDISKLQGCFDSVKRLLIYCDVTDYSNLSRFKQLEILSIETDSFKDFDYSVFTQLKYLKVYYGKVLNSSVSKLPLLSNLRCNNWANTDLSLLEGLSTLKNLMLVDARKLISLEGLKSNSTLKGIYINSAPKLEDLTTLSYLEDIELLYLERCKSVTNYQFLNNLKKLSTLKIIKSKSLESLSFLSNMKLLEVLVLNNTNIENNNLSSILDIPKLTHCSFTGNKEYNLTKNAVSKHILEKWNNNIPDNELWTINLI